MKLKIKLNKNEKEVVCFVGATVAISYMIGALILLIGGFCDSNSNYNDNCNKTYRIDYIIPTRKLACFLGSETDGSKKARVQHDER
jgi:hypothetical protein